MSGKQKERIMKKGIQQLSPKKSKKKRTFWLKEEIKKDAL
jgi:hypothetical protein